MSTSAEAPAASGASSAQPESTPAEELCHGCHKPLKETRKIAMDDAPWHPECFTCDVCKEVINDSVFVLVEGKQAHDRCRKKPNCVKCGKPIPLTVLQALGGEYHPECFTCGKCHEKIVDPNFFLVGAEPVHEKCAEKFSCAACSKDIDGLVLHAQDKNYHSECFRCMKCTAPIPETYYVFKEHVYCSMDCLKDAKEAAIAEAQAKAKLQEDGSALPKEEGKAP
eukprot:RCo030979